ncbi:hypothetical protein M404DRAFT_164623 [Pisolithus tinctorius Marx 270]|uniref:Uncharacterized protein n=1 Tax=Pisolithus tinctorius Marx 270 TaxID=870435 RepID=A0A0C3N4H3_PISTI|nr:hypothetical protein M404DRAFT_164623 [Pisolithus tinctorius Marx 270]
MQDVNVIADHSSYAEINHPAVVIDKEGNILLWYLLNVFGKAYQAEIWNSLGNLSIPLAWSMKSNRAGGWQHNSNHFCQAADLKGTIDPSLAWFQQGCGSCQWLDSMAGPHAVLLGALCIMHLKMYLHRLMAVAQQDEDMQAILPIWNSIYSSMSLMVNQKSPPHKDTNGQKVWLDTLLTVRCYTPLDFVIPCQGCRQEVSPGTVIAMSGVALVHQVNGTDGNQACLAYYM